MTGRAVRKVAVKHKKWLTPNMLRIILCGEALRNFPINFESGYVKLRFLNDALTPTDNERVADEKPRVRSYTVRAFDQKNCELTIDFVSHGDNGPASAWALACNVGDDISIDGPGAAKLINLDADWFFLAGDMTALPAISVNVEQLPSAAIGHVVVEVLSEEDKSPLSVPDGVSVHWVVNAHPDMPNTLLADKVRSIPWQKGVLSVWVASEFSAMKNLRQYFKVDREVNKNNMYISSYWKMGDTDEGHKKAKKIDQSTI
ncbi:MAG: NADPH-dependent ferric siderophore reductase [Granulosicoccus sp.]|jgi:NADPH-dependent ferric siderophore reductase